MRCRDLPVMGAIAQSCQAADWQSRGWRADQHVRSDPTAAELRANLVPPRRRSDDGRRTVRLRRHAQAEARDVIVADVPIGIELLLPLVRRDLLVAIKKPESHGVGRSAFGWPSDVQ